MARGFDRLFVRQVLAAACAGALLAFLGPFETDRAPPLLRAGYWIGLLVFGAGLGHFLRRGLMRLGWIGETAHWRDMAILALAMSLAMTLAVAFANWAVFGYGPTGGSLAFLFLAVSVISVAMTALGALIGSHFAAEEALRLTHAAPASDPAPALRARFLERLPPKLMGAELYAVAAEDHYLRLITSKGEDLILMRLSDAVAELEGLEGAQVHRSWWVARAAVRGVSKEGGRLFLTLPGGRAAPVSRPNVKPLKEAGWF